MQTRSNYSVPTLEDQILVDATEAVQGINQLKSGIASLKAQIDSFSKNNGLSNFSKQTSSIGDAIKKTINFSAIYIGAKQVLGTLKDMTNESVNYAETVNLFNVSMGKGLEGLNQYYEQAIAFQEKLEEKLGVNIEESMRYQALFNSMTKSMGLSANYAYTLSENMTKLGYDLASLYNIDTESAMTKLRAGLAGQTEPLRELGLDITEQSLKPIAQELGITESIRNMSQAEKSVLRYIAVLRQAQIAQGDFANTMDSPANQLRIFNAQVTAFKRNMGNLWQGLLGNILPYINAIMMVINELLKMVARLFGFEVSSQPVNISASVGADDLADDLGTASGKAKELKNQLMGFDEINNITLDTGNNSSSSGGTSGTGIDQRLLDAMKEYDNLMDKVSNKATEIRDKMLQWLGFKRDDDGTWKLKEGLTNFEKILDIVKTIGIAIGTWKISNTVTNLLKNLGILKGKQNFQLAFGITLLATGIFAQYKGTRHLLNGDIDLFTLLETFLGTTSGALGIVSILKATKLGKTLLLGNKLKVGFGIMLAIQGVQVLADGINTGDLKKTILGALELTGSLGIALNGIFGGKLLQGIKNATTGFSNFSSAINISTGTVGKHATAITGLGTSMGSVLKTGATLVAGLAGIAAGSALTYASMKDLTTGEIGAAEGALKLAGGLAGATASGALAGSQFGIVGTAIGGLTGLISSGITAYMGYKDGIESLNIPVTTLTGEIQALSEELDNNRLAHENAVKSIKDTYENQIVEAEYAEELSSQLGNLVDVNGKVIEGNEERVDLILGKLNEALGTEYKLNGNIISQNGKVVKSYKDLRADIDKTIAKKKEEAEQEAFNDLYAESIKNKIKAERDYVKVKEEFAKAEKEYNDLMAQGLSDWTLEHDENYKQIIQNYIDMGDKVKETGEATVNAYEDYAYYTVQMADDTKKLAADMTESTELITNEMISQNKVTSENLQKMVKENVESWNTSYNQLDENTKTTMLTQSTTLDTWSPTLQQKWKDLASNNKEEYNKALSTLPEDTRILIETLTNTTQELSPEQIQKWTNLAKNNKESYNKALSTLPEETRILIETLTSTTQALSSEQIQKWANLAKSNKNAYERNLAGLDDITRSRIQSCVDAINNKQWSAEEASRSLANAVEKGVNTIDTSEAGRQAVNGVARGINQNKNSMTLWNAIGGVVNNVTNWFKERLGIQSPSRVMADLSKYIPLGVAEGINGSSKAAIESVRNMSNNLIGEAEKGTNKLYQNMNGFSVDPQDFKIDANQFVDYGAINGIISMQNNIDSNIAQQVYNAVIEGMRNARVQVDIEAKTDKGIMFKTIRDEAEEFAMQTGENPFPVLL